MCRVHKVLWSNSKINFSSKLDPNFNLFQILSKGLSLLQSGVFLISFAAFRELSNVFWKRPKEEWSSSHQVRFDNWVRAWSIFKNDIQIKQNKWKVQKPSKDSQPIQSSSPYIFIITNQDLLQKCRNLTCKPGSLGNSSHVVWPVSCVMVKGRVGDM